MSASLQNMSASLFVGWPLEAPDPAGRLAYAEDAQCLREALWNVLITNPGERLMRPSFGAGLNQWIGQPNTESTRQLIASSITAAVGRWEQRVALANVDVAPSPADPASVVVTLSYTVRGQRGAPPQQLSLTLTLGGLG
jgi:phage baseplate assembly protein W